MTGQKKRRPRRSALSRDELGVIPLWLELGARAPEIAEALGTTQNSLAVICSRHGISLRAAGTSGAVEPRHWAALQREAARRGIPAWRLVAQILRAVADYELFAAVLGDYDDVQAAHVEEGARRRA